MTKGQLQITVDCTDPAALAPFWATALGYSVLGSFEQYTMLLPPPEMGIVMAEGNEFCVCREGAAAG